MTDLKKRLEELCDEADSAEGNDKGWIDTDVIRCALLASSPVVDAKAVRDRIAGYMASLDHVDWGIAKQIAAGKLYLDRADEVLALLSPTLAAWSDDEQIIAEIEVHQAADRETHPDPAEAREEFYTLEEMTREVPAVPALGLGPMIQHGNMAHEKGQPCAICAVIAQHHEKELK